MFISSVAQRGLSELKDLLWRTINDERNRLVDPSQAAQRDLDERHREADEDAFLFENVTPADAEQEEFVPSRAEGSGRMIGPDSKEWSDEYWAEDYVDPEADWQVKSE